MKVTYFFTAILTTAFVALVIASMYGQKDYTSNRSVAATSKRNTVRTVATASVGKNLPLHVQVNRSVIQSRKDWPEEVLLKTKNLSESSIVRFKVQLLNPKQEQAGVRMITDLDQTYTMPPKQHRNISILYKVNDNFTNKKANIDFRLVPERN